MNININDNESIPIILINSHRFILNDTVTVQTLLDNHLCT